jgi:hypothetical protein
VRGRGENAGGKLHAKNFSLYITKLYNDEIKYTCICKIIHLTSE